MLPVTTVVIVAAAAEFQPYKLTMHNLTYHSLYNTETTILDEYLKFARTQSSCIQCSIDSCNKNYTCIKRK